MKLTKIQSLDNLPERIKSIYSSVSKEEQRYLKQILIELSTTGTSPTYENIWLADFKEVPVSIDTFICDPYYLGSANRQGKAVYPFWRKTLREIFNSGNRYNEIILSGATRIGKTSTAIIIGSYMLYRLMCYRNPHEYFQKKEISKFSFVFANLTKELALGVAYREFNDTLRSSPYFQEHGKFSKSDRNFYYVPEGDKIEIICVSDSSQALGRQCLVGNTKLLTPDGYKLISECEGKNQVIYQLLDDGSLVETNADVVLTKTVNETIRVELEDGSIIEGTPDHKIMLSDGSYKELQELTSSDDLLTLDISEVDQMNFNCYNREFTVYMHVSPNGKRYIGITSQEPKLRWAGGSGYSDNKHFKSAIDKYGWNNFEHIIVASGLSLKAACKMESDLISKYDTMNQEKGYNHTTGGNWSTPDDETRKKLSDIMKLRAKDADFIIKLSNSLKGHSCSDETKKKISEANKGRKLSEEQCAKRRGRKISEETRNKMIGRPSWCKGLTKESDERVFRMSQSRKGIPMTEEAKIKLSESQKSRFANGFDPVWINNGIFETIIQRDSEVPEGFCMGRLNILDTYVYKSSESKKICKSEIDKYLSEGWKLGRNPEVGKSIKKANQKYYWKYENKRFDSANELAEYLRINGYPKIVGSTITSLYLKGFKSSKIYSGLEGKIQKVDV